MFDEYSDLLTIDEVCEILMIGRGTAYKLLASDELHGFQCGRGWRIPKAAIVEYIKEK
ncbi:helix-turn-helix domain-containing protein [Pseudoflavonifractor phocaeensis]|uniref:helix-turn-helix domain-containing protein n=1 Tax=Pseudoflavonifractor phocaeensis TaxID=1870988 RepID=UPI00210A945F|nr:helix-turn-helix domain-containing protein [Pseudoflavonifractor phocaeensis]MCQ4863294.1 helix-turn-helix domain-containing protein [Pseudoflavonifractor phocaeensis]